MFALRCASAITRRSTRVQAVFSINNASKTPIFALSKPSVLHLSHRTYATPSKPKKGSIEEGSRRSSRPRKTEAQKKKEAADKAAQAKKRKEQQAAKKTKDAATKAKAKEREKARKQKAKDAAAKKRAAPKKKPVKKILTEEQQARKNTREEKAVMKQLKTLALKPPPANGVSAYNVFLGERTKATVDDTQTSVSEAFKDAVADYKQLSPQQHEHYNHMANQRTSERKAAFKSWVESHSAEEIRQANNARSKLVVKDPKNAAKYRKIHDERALSRPLPIYQSFVAERFASGDLKQIAPTEAMKLLSQEWKALPDSQRKPYQDAYDEKMGKYRKDFASVYGHQLPIKGGKPVEATA